MTGENEIKEEENSNELSVESIMSAFEQVDAKIYSLHECSGDDFSAFNARLKDYNDRVKSISNNANQILEIIDGETIGNTFTQLNFYHYQIRIYIEDFEKQIENTIIGLDSLIRELNSLQLPLKNYKQNLSTFKYLAANLKLNIAYFAPEQKNDYDEEIDLLHSKIYAVNELYPDLEEGLHVIKTFINDMLGRFRQLRDKNARRTSRILYQTDYSVNFLNAKHADIVSQVMALRSKTSNSTEHVSKIITKLQFHDIIRQKIEHIQSIQKSMIEEIERISQDKELIFQKSIALQIKDMAELQTAQLTHTNKEYQNAIEVIIAQFMDIRENMSFVRKTGIQISTDEELDKTPFSEVEKELFDSVTTLKKLSNSISDFYLEAPVINDAISGILKVFKGLFVTNKEFEEMIDVLITKFISKNDHKEGHKMIRHVKDGSSFTHHIKTIKKSLKQMKVSSTALEESIPTSETEQNVNSKLTDISNQIGDLVATLTSANSEIMKIMEENTSMSVQITTDIKTSINEVKYYDFFDKIIEEVTRHLQDVYYWINASSITAQKGEDGIKSDKLEQLKQEYTMESERIIHQSVIAGEQIDVFADEDEDEDDFELF